MDLKTDIKIDLVDGCKAALDLLAEQLETGNCYRIVRVELGYFHIDQRGPTFFDELYVDTESASRLSEDEVTLLFQGIVCCLPNLKTLVIMSYFRNEAMSLPVAALEILFRRANHLQILLLHQVNLEGSAEECRIMAASLARHASLKRVNIHCDESSTTATSRALNLDPLVCALAGLSTVDYLSLDHVNITEASIHSLAGSQSLRDVSLYNMPQIRPWLPILIDSLSRKDHRLKWNIRGFRIRSCGLQDNEGYLMAKMLMKNTSLRNVVFYIDSSWNDYGSSLAEALAKNTTLQRLEFGIGGNTISSAGMTSDMDRENVTTKHGLAASQIASALAVHPYSSLQHLSLSLTDANDNEIYDTYTQPMEDMLETNYVLESLLLQGSKNKCIPSLSPRAIFLLSLNHPSKLGRSQLFQDVMRYEAKMKCKAGDTKEEHSCDKNVLDPWVDAVIRSNDQEDLLYYILRTNPQMITSSFRN